MTLHQRFYERFAQWFDTLEQRVQAPTPNLAWGAVRWRPWRAPVPPVGCKKLKL